MRLRNGLMVLALGISGPRLVGAQTAAVWQVQGVATTAAAPFVGAGAGVGIRGVGRLGVLGTASIGTADGVFAARVEGLATFHLDPGRRRGMGAYAGAGLALVSSRKTTEEYVLLVLGVESRPRAGRGWFVEMGVGGGVRGVVGLRLRRFPRPR